MAQPDAALGFLRMLRGKPLTREALHSDRMPMTISGRWSVATRGTHRRMGRSQRSAKRRRDNAAVTVVSDHRRRLYREGLPVRPYEADPNAQLYYNDYSLENEAKRKGAVALMRKLKAAGVPIAGIGLQGHVKIDGPDAAQEAATIEAFAALGLQVNISELDVDLLPRTTKSDSADVSMTAAATAQSNPYTSGLPEEMQQALAKRYAELFKVFVQHHDSLGRVTLWGVTDRESWLNNFPARGRTNYPLLFDREGKPKPAFFAVLREATPAAEAPVTPSNAK